MERDTYERPREKLRYRGATTLSTVELLQVLISSGTSRYSSAKIARKLASKLETSNNNLTYEELIIIDGLGNAKVCQVLAVLELSRRQYSTSLTSPTTNENRLNTDLIMKSTKQLLLYETYDGVRRLIKTHNVYVSAGKYKTVVRRICAELVVDGAAYVSYGLGYSQQTLAPSIEELSFIKALVDGAKVLQVKVDGIWLINKFESIDIRNLAL